VTPDLLVSVLTPSFNQGVFLEENIESVLSQDSPRIEHIIVDGGSSDATLEVLEKYDSEVKWISEPDRGQAHALNKGLAMANGEVIGWLNADDTYLPNAVSTSIRVLSDCPAITMTYSRVLEIDAQGRPLGEYPYLEPFDLDRYLNVNPGIIPQQGVFIRADAIREVGGWDESRHMAMDYDLFLKVAARNPSAVLLIDDILANFRRHDLAKTSLGNFYPEVVDISRAYGGRRYSTIFWRGAFYDLKTPLRILKRRLRG